MQSKTTRGVRHVLVSTGVISLVLSVAAPAALAAADEAKGKSEPKNEHADNTGTGTTRVEICHNGRVIEVDDDGELGGHSKHASDVVLGAPDDVTDQQRESCTGTPGGDTQEGDAFVEVCLAGTLVEVAESDLTGDEVLPVEVDGEPTCAGEAIIGDGELVEICRAGELLEVDASEVTADDLEPEESEGGDLTCPGETIGGGDKVEVCHQGSVIEIAAEALEEHLGHGDAEMAEGVTCPVIIDEKVKDIDIDPVVVLDDPVVVEVEVPVKNPPATPVQPIPAAQPRSVVNISTDTVTKPIAPTPKVEQNEVLGAVTTRTPTPGVGALDPGAHTAASITALAATGADGTKILAVAGVVLLLSGFGLQISGRRRMRSAMVEA